MADHLNRFTCGWQFAGDDGRMDVLARDVNREDGQVTRDIDTADLDDGKAFVCCCPDLYAINSGNGVIIGNNIPSLVHEETGCLLMGAGFFVIAQHHND